LAASVASVRAVKSATLATGAGKPISAAVNLFLGWGGVGEEGVGYVGRSMSEKREKALSHNHNTPTTSHNRKQTNRQNAHLYRCMGLMSPSSAA
jgi:hypothetical protein